MSFVGCISDNREYEKTLQRQIAAMTPEEKVEYWKRKEDAENFAYGLFGWIFIIGFIITAAFFIWLLV